LTQIAPQILTKEKPVRMDGLVLLYRSYCHLCDEMRDQLNDMGIAPEIVDVDASATLLAQWDEKVPVLLLNGAELCHYRLNERAIKALIDVK
jgi:glutaredoxin